MSFSLQFMFCVSTLSVFPVAAWADAKIPPPPNFVPGFYTTDNPQDCGAGDARIEAGEFYDTLRVGEIQRLELVRSLGGIDEQNNCRTVGEFRETYTPQESILRRTVNDSVCPAELAARTLGPGLAETEEWTFRTNEITYVRETFPNHHRLVCQWRRE